MKSSDLERFEGRVERVTESGCWIWLGSLASGYGNFTLGSKQCHAHRAAYLHWRGPIAAGLELDHLCRVPCCANPWHLEPVTGRTNVLRGVGPSAINARKTACVKGHPLSGDNLFQRGAWRGCKACRREATRKHDAVRKLTPKRREQHRTYSRNAWRRKNWGHV